MNTISRHGVLLSIDSSGVLIVGPSGIGKSELALHLLDRGHRLVADDAPLLSRTEDAVIFGQCPEVLQDFLSVHGLGVLNIRRLYGDRAVVSGHRLDIIIRLEQDTERLNRGEDASMRDDHRQRRILGVLLPELTLRIKAGRDHALWVECAVRNLQLYRQGYDADQDIQHRLSRVIMRRSA